MKNINPDIFAFYKDLDKNNNREWFENQKVRFKALESEVKDFNELVKYGLEETDAPHRSHCPRPSACTATIHSNYKPC